MYERKTIDIINGHEINLTSTYIFLEQGKIMDAIQYIREQSGISLKEAKEYVDKLKKESGIAETENAAPRNLWDENTEDDAVEYNHYASKKLFSEHKDISDHSFLHKLLSILGMWVIWGSIYGITHVPAIRQAIINFVAENYTVDWLTFWSKIILNDLKYIAIIFLIGSVVILAGKQKYNGLKIYNQGIGFLKANTNEELYAPYEEINLDYGKGQSSVRIECKPLKIREQFYFKDFSQPDVMLNNLERFAKWGIHMEGKKQGRS